MKSSLATIKNRIYNNPEILILLYFFVITSFLAIKFKLGIAPDEDYHYGAIRFYAQNSVDPILSNQNSEFYLGELIRQPSYLYHFILSYGYRFFSLFSSDPHIGLRLINIIFGLLTLYFLNKLSKLLKISKKTRTISLFFIANIPMFIFLSASINYDNLMILLSIIGIYLALLIARKPQIVYAILLLAVVFIGPLVKLSFLPISLCLGLYSILNFFKSRHKYNTQLKSRLKSKDIQLILATLFLIVSAGLFSERYIQNFITYRQFEPSCIKILKQKQCEENALYMRTQRYHAIGDKNVPINPTVYTSNWLSIMNSRTFGLFGHKSFNASSKIMLLSIFFYYVLFIAFFRYVKMGMKYYYYLIPSIFLFYTISLILTNVKAYQYTGDVKLAVQGRYWFPVLLPFTIYVLSMFNIDYLKISKKYRFALYLLLVVIFIFLGPISIIRGIDASWLT